MAEAWEPANELEQNLRDALRGGDEDTYFAVLAGADLFVPLPPGEAGAIPANATDFIWHTSTSEGRTHVLAFTSPDSARICLGPAYAHVIKLSFADIARSWPDQEWWLAINAGLPIEGYLPAWFVTQLASHTPKAAGGQAHNGPVSPFESRDDEERARYEVAERDDDAGFLRALGWLWLPVAEGGDPSAGPGRPLFPWFVTEVNGRPAVTVFTGPDHMHDAIGDHPFVISDPAKVVRYWPDPAWDLIVKGGPHIDASITGDRIAAISEEIDRAAAQRLARDFPAQHDTERRMFDRRNDPDELTEVALSTTVFLPVWTPPTVPAAPADPAFPWTAVPVRGRTSVPVFTSFDWMKEAMGTTEFVTHAFADLVAAWPNAEWSLVLNLGTPIELLVPGDHVRGLAGHPVSATANEVERLLRDVAGTEAFIRTLLGTEVLIPLPPGIPAEVRPSDPEFSWRTIAIGDHTAILLFTSPERLHAYMGESEAGYVTAGFLDVIRAWPNAEWSLSLNPGTEIELLLGPDQVRALAPPIQERTTPPADQERTSAPPDQERVPAPPDQERVPAPPDQERVPAHGSPGPAIMQKVVPHSHVSWYLDQAYDRVGGFVHRAKDVIDLAAPGHLYDALGLTYEGSPFSHDDEEVHVIRWPAHRADLYRTPFGGRSEEELKAWRDGGWVVENAPFDGSGFAPGSGGSIPEFKIDSLRLPHGSAMYALRRDRSERTVALYDADRLTWLRTAEEDPQ